LKFEDLPLFKGRIQIQFGLLISSDVSPDCRIELFKAKLKGCCKMYNFKDPKGQVAEKDQKKQVLMELVDYVNTNKNVFCPEVMDVLMKMVK
jgi:serine/threonine-protein phosphatase 2A regulatory subunit B'